jgi:hypothetical protein
MRFKWGLRWKGEKEHTPDFISQAKPIHNRRREDQLLIRELYISCIVLELVLHQALSKWVDIDWEEREARRVREGRVWGGDLVLGLAVWVVWGLEGGVGFVRVGLGWDGDWELVVCVQTTERGYEGWLGLVLHDQQWTTTKGNSPLSTIILLRT